jgi:hypothetical protein
VSFVAEAQMDMVVRMGRHDAAAAVASADHG